MTEGLEKNHLYLPIIDKDTGPSVDEKKAITPKQGPSSIIIKGTG